MQVFIVKKYNYEPDCATTIKLWLRRTLVLHNMYEQLAASREPFKNAQTYSLLLNAQQYK